MGRQIDETQPLSETDRAWLISRNDWTAIARIDGTSPPASAAPGAVTGHPQMAILSDWMRLNYPDEVDRGGETIVDCVIRLLGPNGPDPAEGDPVVVEVAPESPVDDDGVPAPVAPDAAVGLIETEDNDVDYDESSVDALKAELERRELSRSGNKADLVDRLREDDQD